MRHFFHDGQFWRHSFEGGWFLIPFQNEKVFDEGVFDVTWIAQVESIDEAKYHGTGMWD